MIGVVGECSGRAPKMELPRRRWQRAAESAKGDGTSALGVPMPSLAPGRFPALGRLAEFEQREAAVGRVDFIPFAPQNHLTQLPLRVLPWGVPFLPHRPLPFS